MSTTDKLAQALRKIIAHTGVMPSAGKDLLLGLLQRCERIASEALAEYAASQSTPAAEVTADACRTTERKEMKIKFFSVIYPYMVAKPGFITASTMCPSGINGDCVAKVVSFEVEEALAQQVEDLAVIRDEMRAEIATLSAENARLKVWKDAIYICTENESAFRAIRWMELYAEEQVRRLDAATAQATAAPKPAEPVDSLWQSPERVRRGVAILKEMAKLRQPHYELPADSFLETAVLKILGLAQVSHL